MQDMQHQEKGRAEEVPNTMRWVRIRIRKQICHPSIHTSQPKGQRMEMAMQTGKREMTTQITRGAADLI